VALDHSFRHIGQPKPRECAIEQLCGSIAGELAFDAHSHIAIPSFELPRIKTPMRRQAQIDAIVSNQVPAASSAPADP